MQFKNLDKNLLLKIMIGTALTISLGACVSLFVSFDLNSPGKILKRAQYGYQKGLNFLDSIFIYNQTGSTLLLSGSGKILSSTGKIVTEIAYQKGNVLVHRKIAVSSGHLVTEKQNLIKIFLASGATIYDFNNDLSEIDLVKEIESNGTLSSYAFRNLGQLNTMKPIKVYSGSQVIFDGIGRLLPNLDEIVADMILSESGATLNPQRLHISNGKIIALNNEDEKEMLKIILSSGATIKTERIDFSMLPSQSSANNQNNSSNNNGQNNPATTSQNSNSAANNSANPTNQNNNSGSSNPNQNTSSLPPATPSQADNDQDGFPNYNDSDIDGDGIPNGQDPDVDGDGIPNGQDPDVDGDGIPNGQDPDVDGDGSPNASDPDIDGDGILNGSDRDADGDGIPNSIDSDTDGDGIPNGAEPDVNNDGVPNGSDPDIDGDGVPNGADQDMDGDGIPNNIDPDIDGDGMPNETDPHPNGTENDTPNIPTSYTQEDLAFYDQAIQKLDLQLCKNIQAIALKQDCEQTIYYNKGVSEYNLGYCDQLLDADKKQFCHNSLTKYLAVTEGKISKCTEINNDESLYETCLNEVNQMLYQTAMETKNPQICKPIYNAVLQKQCFDALGAK